MTNADGLSLWLTTPPNRRSRQPEAGRGAASEMTGQGLSEVAVVDDDHAVLESVADLLNSAGHVARTFSSAKEFIDGGALDSIGCLVSDIRMPVMDGWELRAFVHGLRPDLPVILITAHLDSEQEARALQAAGHLWRVFRKPFDGCDLLSAIESALRPGSP
jgi:FixJ family two-component response regulator